MDELTSHSSLKRARHNSTSDVMSPPFVSKVLKDQATSLDDKLKLSRERIKSLNSTIAELSQQIDNLKQRLTSEDSAWLHSADDEIARELTQLYYNIRDWTIKTIRGMRSGS